jgi:hypothetical protein
VLIRVLVSRYVIFDLLCTLWILINILVVVIIRLPCKRKHNCPCNLSIPQMSSILSYDIIAHIIDIVGENKDTDLLKELALVSHSFHQICSKHLFATVELHTDQKNHLTSSKTGILRLLDSRPNIVKYIRKLTYEVSYNTDNDHLLSPSPTLPNFLRTISCLKCLTINCSNLDWNTLDDSLTSALLYLMHLPTINHIDLSFIENFPTSSLIPSVNLLRLTINSVIPLEEEEIITQSEIMPKIREFHTTFSILLTTKLLHAKKQDGQPAFNFMDLRRLTICHGNEQNIRYLLRNAKSLENFHLLSVECDQSFEGLHDILSARAGSLKSFDLTLALCEEYDGSINLPFEALCEELEAMAGHYVLEALSFEVHVIRNESAGDIGSMIQSVEKVLVKRGCLR